MDLERRDHMLPSPPRRSRLCASRWRACPLTPGALPSTLSGAAPSCCAAFQSKVGAGGSPGRQTVSLLSMMPDGVGNIYFLYSRNIHLF